MKHPSLFEKSEIDQYLKWAETWNGMPEFSQTDMTAVRQLIVSFLTSQEVTDFAKTIKQRIGSKQKSIWFPEARNEKPKNFAYVNTLKEQPRNRYPIYIISKGRWENPLTVKALEKINADYKIVVEPTEVGQYKKTIAEERILTLPFHDLGQGSIPARNWVFEHAKQSGAKRHWILDDNIHGFVRLNKNRKIQVHTTATFAAIEDWVDRYENIAMAGMNYRYFAPERCTQPPYLLNTRIYSCILLDNSILLRWRGRYNEDTDLSLRILKAGLCTVLFQAFLCNKVGTLKMKGGNTDTIYATGDKRREFAESLRKQHPDLVKVVWRYDRWHHEVDYTPFRFNELKLKKDIKIQGGQNEYGMKLIRLNQKKGE